jgi:[ribosomal protein S5]-alanine N-acetyltransferase
MRRSTPRLELVAATLEHVCAELESVERLARLLGARLSPGWPPGEYDRGAQEFFRDRLREGGAAAVGWYTWYALRRGSAEETPMLVGAGGYFGPPSDDGVVEIGFSILPGWRNRGYATEVADGLVRNAFADPRVRKVIARAAATNAPSCRVLDHCGFRLVGTDAESGHRLYAVVAADDSGPRKD